MPKETIRHCDAEPCEAEAIQNDYKISIKAWIASACFASSQASQRRYMNFEIPREHTMDYHRIVIRRFRAFALEI